MSTLVNRPVDAPVAPPARDLGTERVPEPAVPPARRGFFDALAEQRRLVYLLVALLSIAGIWAALRLPSAIYPELAFQRIAVVAEGSALDARQMVFSVTRPLEEAIAVVPGVTRVRSRSIRGGSEISVTFTPSTDMAYALQQVQGRVGEARTAFPADVTVQVERLTPSVFPILSYNLEGGDPATLYDIARYQIRPVLSRVPGVGRVDVQGSDVREIEVVADPTRLAAEGLSYDDLANAIRQSTDIRAVGRVVDAYRQFLVVAAQEARSAEDVGNVVVGGRGLRVRDLATVTPGTADRTRVIAGDGRPAAQLNITRQPGGNTLALADSVAAIARSIGPTLPAGVHLVPVYDRPRSCATRWPACATRCSLAPRSRSSCSSSSSATGASPPSRRRRSRSRWRSPWARWRSSGRRST